MKRLLTILCLTTVVLASSAPAVCQTGPSTWTDPDTGLIWTAHDNGAKIGWNEATAYCRNLQLAGRSDWRLPALDELRAIFDPMSTAKVAGSSDVHIKGNLQLSHSLQWSSTPAPPTDDGKPEAWIFRFFDAGSQGRYQTPYPGHALCVSGKPPQPDQGPTLTQTVNYLRSKFNADSRMKIEILGNGIMNFARAANDDTFYYRVDPRLLRTIGQEQCEEQSKEGTKSYPCIHITGLGWDMFSRAEPDKFFDASIKQSYIWFEPGTDVGPILKALKRLAVLYGAKIADDDLFR